MAPRAENPRDSEKYKIPTWKKLLAGGAAVASVNMLTACNNTDVEAAPQPNETVNTTSAPVTPGEGQTVAPVDTESPSSEPTPTMDVPQVTSPTPTGIETTEPAPAETAKSFEQQVTELEISAELSPEQLAETYADRLSQWYMAGTGNQELYEQTYGDFTKTRGEHKALFAEKSAEQAEVFRAALYEDDWNRRPSLYKHGAAVQEANAMLMDQYYINEGWGTSSYVQLLEASNATVVDTGDGNELGLSFTLTERNNASEVNLDVYKAAPFNGDSYTAEAVFVKEGNAFKLRRLSLGQEVLDQK